MPETTTSCKRDEEKKQFSLTLDNVIIIIIVIIVIVIVVKALTSKAATPSNPGQFIGTSAQDFSTVFELGATPVA
jgi:hypothetical protein